MDIPRLSPAIADDIVPELAQIFADNPFKSLRNRNIRVPVLCGPHEQGPTDTHINIFGQEFRTHSSLLKQHTRIWKDRQHGEYTARRGHYFEARTEKDGGWGIYRKGAKYYREYPPFPEERIPTAIETFHCLLQALYLKPVPYIGIRGWRRMVSLGIRFQAVPRVREYIEKIILPWTLTATPLDGLTDDILTHTKMAQDIQCARLYRECFIHLIGMAQYWGRNDFHHAENMLTPSAYASLIHHVASQRQIIEKADVALHTFIQSMTVQKPRRIPNYLLRQLTDTVDNVTGLNGRNMNSLGYYRQIRHVLNDMQMRIPRGTMYNKCHRLWQFIGCLCLSGLQYTEAQVKGYPVFFLPAEIELPWELVSRPDEEPKEQESEEEDITMQSCEDGYGLVGDDL
ncbi:hypothetical protein ASPCADRAFT_517338 [Aspergillus carbonarius ITEM 5010]|uniref:BTB domain-containing protein n=1 Tax=Aspergillus carbonarius (strain ITEM 5010) TaxID=602072 RepID=A0A1R3RFA9_ASPC5|nr:hypothetical protein ASPCADRAFT_517338 [Aspergillus carbonarius ITEM 5010]